MPDTISMRERPGAASEPVRIGRSDGTEVPARLRLLSYDGCELETKMRFKSGDEVRIHLYRMGWIRARVTSCRSKVIEAEFIKECPV